MARKCTVCEHESHKDIDKSLVSPNASFRTISQQYHISRDALRRHVENGHIATKIKKAANAHEALEAENFLIRIQKRHTRFDEMAREAKNNEDPHLELKVYQTQSKFIELEGRAVGAFKDKLSVGGEVKITDARDVLARKLDQLATRASKKKPDQ